jgi:hypothetical protein
MAPEVYHAPPEEAVGLAIDSYIAALPDSDFDALVTRTRPPKLSPLRNGKRRSASDGQR